MLYFYLAKVPPTEFECWTFTCDGVFLLLCWIWTLRLQLILIKAKLANRAENSSFTKPMQPSVLYYCLRMFKSNISSVQDYRGYVIGLCWQMVLIYILFLHGAARNSRGKYKKEKRKSWAVGVSLAINFIWHDVKVKTDIITHTNFGAFAKYPMV